MAWEIAYRCDRCRRVERVRTGDFRFYVVPWQGKDSELFDRVHCWDQEGWCNRCRHLRPVEKIPDLALLILMREVKARTGLTDQEKELAAHSGQTQEEELQRDLARFDEQIRWRKERRSPPKCLVCGSQDVEALEAYVKAGGDRTHPGCGGSFQICEDPCHIQPAVGYLIPAEGPGPPRGLQRLRLWFWRRLGK
jgi:hypothetical protein